MSESTQRQTFRATVSKEAGEWVAHCLDLDIVSTGPTAAAAMDALAEALGLQLAYARENDNFEYLVRPAPNEAWQKLAEIMKGPHETFIREIDDSNSGLNLLEAQAVAA
jgi:predicted RNase H-like HicB family nuclease